MIVYILWSFPLQIIIRRHCRGMNFICTAPLWWLIRHRHHYVEYRTKTSAFSLHCRKLLSISHESSSWEANWRYKLSEIKTYTGVLGRRDIIWKLIKRGFSVFRRLTLIMNLVPILYLLNWQSHHLDTSVRFIVSTVLVTNKYKLCSWHLSQLKELKDVKWHPRRNVTLGILPLFICEKVKRVWACLHPPVLSCHCARHVRIFWETQSRLPRSTFIFPPSSRHKRLDGALHQVLSVLCPALTNWNGLLIWVMCHLRLSSIFLLFFKSWSSHPLYDPRDTAVFQRDTMH